MKNAIQFKDLWLMKSSKAYELFQDWKNTTVPALAKIRRKTFEDHLKEVNTAYEKSLQN